MLAIVADAGHHVGAAEALRILERRIGDQLSGFKIEEPQDNSRGTEVHGDTVNRAVRAIYLDAIDQDAVAVASYRRV